MYLFSMENPFFRFMGRLTDLVWINILTLICCIPVFTAGAALSAMFHVLVKISLKEEGTITRPFFRELRANFKNATIVWIPSLLILTVMFLNGNLIERGILDPYPRLRIVAGVSIGIITAVVVMFLTYFLALISRYDNELKQSVKNALLMMVAYFPRSLCMLVIWVSPIALMMLSDYFLFLWFLYGLSFPAYIISMLLGSLFIKTEKVNQN